MSSEVYKALLQAQGALGSIKPTGKNTGQGYTYLSDSDLMNAINPALTANGLLTIPADIQADWHDRENVTVSVKWFIVHAETGQSVEMLIRGQGRDKGDKALYKALTGARKYLFRLLFNIATGDDSEHDNPASSSHISQPSGARSAPVPSPAPLSPPPLPVDTSSWTAAYINGGYCNRAKSGTQQLYYRLDLSVDGQNIKASAWGSAMHDISTAFGLNEAAGEGRLDIKGFCKVLLEQNDRGYWNIQSLILANEPEGEDYGPPLDMDSEVPPLSPGR